MPSYYDESSIAANTRVNMPQFDTSGILKAGQLLNESLNSVRNRELEDYKIKKEQDEIAENKRRWEIANSRAEAQESRAADEYARGIRKEQATNDAIRAVMDPKGYQAGKMAEEQKAVEEAYKLMSPEDVAAVKAQYDPAASGKQWLDVANSATGVDVGRVLDTKSRQYEIAAKTPGTPEYIAAEKAKMDLYEREQAIAHKNRMSEIGAQAGAQLNYLKATQDAPQKMVNPQTGEARYVRPSELEKYPGYMDASTYSATLTDKRDREEKQRQFDLDLSKVVTKGKEDLANAISTYDDESRSAILTGTADANAIIKEFNTASGKNIKGLTNSDISSMIKRSKGIALVPWGRDDLNTDVFRQSLAGEISQKTGMKYEDVLDRLEGIESKQPTTGKVIDKTILNPGFGY